MNKIPPAQQVNRVGKYLNKNIPGAFKLTFSPNQCDVYFRVYYQIPYLQRRPGMGEFNDVSEMIMNINVTTYGNKIRMNITEVSPEEKTICFVVCSEDECQNLNILKAKVWDKLTKSVNKEYEGYDFVF